MIVLLDTHALLWAGYLPGKLSATAATLISDPQNQIVISAASAWEIATKVRLGKLPGAEELERNFMEKMVIAGFTVLPITAELALRAGRLVGNHGDPFDRMIAAQSLTLDIPVLSADTQLDIFGVRRIW